MSVSEVVLEVSWLTRLHAERDELAARLEKLDAFIGSLASLALSFYEKEDLSLQADVMRRYLTILNRRISRTRIQK